MTRSHSTASTSSTCTMFGGRGESSAISGGPAAASQPTYQTRVTDGKIEVRTAR